MKKLAIATALCVSGLGLTGLASASDQTTFSTEEYCSLAQSNYKSDFDEQYLKAYAAKLGSKPSRALCQSIKAEKYSNKVAFNSNWDYSFNKPTQGSIVRLSQSTIRHLRANKISGSDVFGSF